MSRFFKYVLLAIGILSAVIAWLGLHLNKSQNLFPRVVKNVFSAKTTQPKDSVKTTLDNLNTKSIIVNFKDNKEDLLIHKKTPKEPIAENKDISKVTTANGAVELSVDKLSVLPSMEAAGSITIHLDKDKKKKHKSTEETKSVKEGSQK